MRMLSRIDRLRETVEASQTTARGRLRVSIPRALGERGPSQGVVSFLAAHPDIRMELRMEDRFVDLVEEGYDAAIRIDRLAESSLIARKLANFRIVVTAAPQLLATHGRPQHPSELAGLPCVLDANLRSRLTWRFRENGANLSVNVSGRVDVNSPEAAAAAARAGLGFCRGPWVIVREDVQAGRLVTLLEAFEPDDLGIYAVYPHRARMPAKLRAFIDHLAAWYEAERRAGRTC
jgi:DNA-binding transcriptional LysR family regulator